MRITRRSGIAALLILFGVCGCNEAFQVQRQPEAPRRFSLAATSGCGSSYTMVTYQEDSLMTTYGIPPLQDTISVCDSWTGLTLPLFEYA